MGFPYITLALATVAAPSGQAAATIPNVISWHAEGTQIYSCQTSPTGYGPAGYGWALKQPEAVLIDAAGHICGHHGAGPSWTAADGSRVTGRVVSTIPAPLAGAVPWLVLHVDSHAGHGVLERVDYVLRTDTVGGAAPASGCDAAHASAETQVAYTATYSFLNAPDLNDPGSPVPTSAQRPIS